MNNKVLLGKDDYLFLQNDTNEGLNKHSKSIIPTICINNLQSRYNSYIEKLLFVIFPDKEVICKDFLPNNKTSKFLFKFSDVVLMSILLQKFFSPS